MGYQKNALLETKKKTTEESERGTGRDRQTQCKND